MSFLAPHRKKALNLQISPRALSCSDFVGTIGETHLVAGSDKVVSYEKVGATEPLIVCRDLVTPRRERKLVPVPRLQNPVANTIAQGDIVTRFHSRPVGLALQCGTSSASSGSTGYLHSASSGSNCSNDSQSMKHGTTASFGNLAAATNSPTATCSPLPSTFPAAHLPAVSINVSSTSMSNGGNNDNNAKSMTSKHNRHENRMMQIQCHKEATNATQNKKTESKCQAKEASCKTTPSGNRSLTPNLSFSMAPIGQHSNLFVLQTRGELSRFRLDNLFVRHWQLPHVATAEVGATVHFRDFNKYEVVEPYRDIGFRGFCWNAKDGLFYTVSSFLRPGGGLTPRSSRRIIWTLVAIDLKAQVVLFVHNHQYPTLHALQLSRHTYTHTHTHPHTHTHTHRVCACVCKYVCWTIGYPLLSD